MRKEAERRKRVEAEHRIELEKSAQVWREANILRRFIKACEQRLVRDGGGLTVDGWQREWLNWAQEHADRIDPMTNGFLENERQKLVAQTGMTPPS
jgi:hypothetical protein